MCASVSLNWEKIKIRYLEMRPEDKRNLYKCGGNYKTVHQLPTWEEYARTKTTLGERVRILDNSILNSAKNAELRKKISIFNGDIASLEVDAIVNAASSSLLGGGGTDGAIHAAAGPELREECRSLKGCNMGEAKITCGYKLPAKYVIHTVGPKSQDSSLIAACYRNSLNLALKGNLRSIAFPCISSNVNAAHIALREVRTFLEKYGSSTERIIFCLNLASDVALYEGALQSYFPVPVPVSS